jgi:hypothetical protein
MTPERPYTRRMEDERSAVEVVRDAFDGIHKFFLGILLLGVAVASIVAGGTAGWALGRFALGPLVRT